MTVDPLADEIPQHDRHRQRNAELRRHGERLKSGDGGPGALSHALPCRGNFSLSESYSRSRVRAWIRLSLWERPRAARVRGAYEIRTLGRSAPLTPTLSQREREPSRGKRLRGGDGGFVGGEAVAHAAHGDD